MAWIELHQELRTHPKIARLAAGLKVEKATAVGYVSCLWMWAAAYSQDGELTTFSPAEIADACLFTGDPEKLRKALIDCGFVDEVGENLAIHDWKEHGMKLLEAKREWKRKSDLAKKQRLQQMSPGEPTVEPPENHVGTLVGTTVPTNLTNHTLPNQPTEPTEPRVGNLMPSDLESRKTDLEAYLMCWWGKQGRIPSAMMHEFLNLKRQYGYTALGEAIIKAAKANAMSFRYVEAILKPKANESPIDRSPRSTGSQSILQIIPRHCEKHTDTPLVDDMCPKCYPVCKECKERHSLDETCEESAERLAGLKKFLMG